MLIVIIFAILVLVQLIIVQAACLVLTCTIISVTMSVQLELIKKDQIVLIVILLAIHVSQVNNVMHASLVSYSTITNATKIVHQKH